MKSKIGFVCIGQAGGNIGNILEQRGFNCLFVNSSEEDLKTLNVKYRYHIPEGEGCNHDREKAISLIKKHYKKIVEQVNDKLYHQNLIYLVFSAGGGTGSGSSSILLEALNACTNAKNFGCITILPSENEAPKSHMNAYKCYQELSCIDRLASVFTIDNNKGNKFTLNSTFAELFCSVLDFPKHIDVRGNTDIAEVREMLMARGNAVITTCNQSNNLTSGIIRSWEQNIFADLELDKHIVYMGLSLSDTVDVEDLKRHIGYPLDVFTNYNQNRTVTLLTGLTFPKTRISKIVDNLNRNKDTIKNTLLNSKTNKIDFSIDWLDDIQKPAEKICNIDELFSKY